MELSELKTGQIVYRAPVDHDPVEEPNIDRDKFSWVVVQYSDPASRVGDRVAEPYVIPCDVSGNKFKRDGNTMLLTVLRQSGLSWTPYATWSDALCAARDHAVKQSERAKVAKAQHDTSAAAFGIASDEAKAENQLTKPQHAQLPTQNFPP